MTGRDIDLSRDRSDSVWAFLEAERKWQRQNNILDPFTSSDFWIVDIAVNRENGSAMAQQQPRRHGLPARLSARVPICRHLPSRSARQSHKGSVCLPHETRSKKPFCTLEGLDC
jgi:hypothetical protein